MLIQLVGPCGLFSLYDNNCRFVTDFKKHVKECADLQEAFEDCIHMNSDNFRLKIFDLFLIIAQNINCECTLEPLH